jgi:transcriptional regulator with XRE-family HTH domain
MTAQSATLPKPALESLLWDGIEYDEKEENRRNKREDVGIELCGLLHHAGITRSDLARRLEWKPSRVTRALSGNENLTLDTLTTLINALGMDYDLVFRKQGTCRTFQPWEREQLDDEILQMHGELSATLGEVKALHRHASATLQTAQEISRAMFCKAHAIKQATRDKARQAASTIKTFAYYEESYAAVAR